MILVGLLCCTKLLASQATCYLIDGMRSKAQALLRDALDLPESERAQIVDALLESLEPPPEKDVESAWRAEVAARVAALDAGEIDTIPWEQVRDEPFSGLSDASEG